MDPLNNDRRYMTTTRTRDFADRLATLNGNAKGEPERRVMERLGALLQSAGLDQLADAYWKLFYGEGSPGEESLESAEAAPHGVGYGTEVCMWAAGHKAGKSDKPLDPPEEPGKDHWVKGWHAGVRERERDPR